MQTKCNTCNEVIYGELTLHTHKTKCKEQSQKILTKKDTQETGNKSKPNNIFTVLLTEGVETQKEKERQKEAVKKRQTKNALKVTKEVGKGAKK